jgi:hypothetical protein
MRLDDHINIQCIDRWVTKKLIDQKWNKENDTNVTHVHLKFVALSPEISRSHDFF